MKSTNLVTSLKTKPTKAPAPIESVKGSDAPAKDLEKLSPDDYRAERNRQRAARGR